MTWQEKISYKIKRHNPYEFLGPLNNLDLFINREKELEDAFLVCDQVVQGKVGGVFVIGNRASGKTTFLKKLEGILSNEDFIVVRIPLDEGMVELGKEDRIFKAMVSQAIIKIRESDLIDQSMRDKLLNYIRGLGELEAELDFPGIKFLVKWRQNEAEDSFSYFVLKDALDDVLKLLIDRGAKRQGVIFMFDEGDILSLNRTILQIMRNVFQDSPQMCLVIAGTNKIIEDISDVFSPIPRFFKKVIIGPFPSEAYMLEAISKPFEHAVQELMSEGTVLRGHFKQFNRQLVELARRMPMEINLLCHYAYNAAADKLRKNDSLVQLYFNVDRALLDVTIEQLRGSVGYGDFIYALTEEEISCMQLLSASMLPLSNEELEVLMVLNKIDQGLLDMDINDIFERIVKDSFGFSTKMNPILTSLSEKSSVSHLDVISKTVMDRPLYSTNDEWISSYFKLGWAKRIFDLDKGFIPSFGGVHMFRDPISSIFHSIFLLKKYEALRGSTKFKVRSTQGSSRSFRAPKSTRQYFIIDFYRVANNLPYYYVMNIRGDFDLTETKQEAIRLLKILREKNIISKYEVSVLTNWEN